MYLRGMVSRLVGGLGERLASVATLEEAERIVRDAACALGFSHCQIVPGSAPRDGGIVVPVLGRRGVVATILCRSERPVARASERQLALIAMQLSVWWTRRGIDEKPRAPALTPRQLEIAKLAARGRTNCQIAEALRISVNTVKQRLKQAFQRLGVNNRIELSNLLRDA